MIKAVLFDMDGILFDSEGYYMSGTVAWMRAAGYTGTNEQVYTIIGTNMAQTYDMLYEMLDHRLSREEIRQKNDEYFAARPLNCREVMFPGIPEVLAKLKEYGLKLACCSSSPRPIIDRALREMGITGDFDVIIDSDSMKRPKPAPDVYLTAAQMLGAEPAECVVYEDSRFGIEAGKNAGMTVIAREDRRFGQDQSECDVLVRDCQEMLAYIEGELNHAGSH